MNVYPFGRPRKNSTSSIRRDPTAKLFPTTNSRIQRIHDSTVTPPRVASPSPKASGSPHDSHEYHFNQHFSEMSFNDPNEEDITPAIGIGSYESESPDRQPTIDSSPPGSGSFKAESIMSTRRLRKERGGSIGEDGRGTPVNPALVESQAEAAPVPKGQVPKLSSRYQSGDVILLSGDGVLFKVHKSQIVKYAPLLASHSDQARLMNDLDLPPNVLPLQEKSVTLEILLPFIYHRKSSTGPRPPSVPTPETIIPDRSFEEVIDACEASAAFGMEKVRVVLKSDLISRAKTPLQFLQLYALADKLRDLEWLRSCSRQTLAAPIIDYGYHIMSTMSPEACNALWYLHSIRSERARKVLNVELSEVPVGEKDGEKHIECEHRAVLEEYWNKTSRKLLVEAKPNFDPRMIVNSADYTPQGLTCITCYRCLMNTVETMDQMWKDVPTEVNFTNYHIHDNV